MKFQVLGLTAYIIYLPVFLLTLLYLKWQNNKRSIKTLWVSSLGQSNAVYSRLFNISISLFGLLSLIFIYSFQSLLPKTLISHLGLLSLYSTSAAVFMVGFYPLDVAKKDHFKIAILLFGSIIFSSLLTIHSVYYSPLIPKWAIILNIVLLISFILPAVSWFYDFTKQSYPLVFNKIVKQKRGVYEWISCFMAAFWSWSMAIFTLLALI